MTGRQIILVEDEAAIADAVAFALGREGFAVRRRGLGREGLDDFLENGADLVILDVGLPDMNGLDVCREIRKRSNVPVIFLTARNSETDLVVGLEIGGDDYITKPFSPRELVARVRAMLRRGGGAPLVEAQPAGAPAAPPQPAGAGGPLFQVDEGRGGVVYAGAELSLTRHEYLVLTTLLSQPGRVFSRAQIMGLAWDSPENSLERAVDTHIKSLRAKLREHSPDFDPIQTKRGFGYFILLEKP